MPTRRYAMTGSGDATGYDGHPYVAARENRIPALAQIVAASLFTWRRAEDDDGNTRMGWWADTYAARPLGSRLWVLARSKVTSTTIERARQYAADALAWLVTDGYATEVLVDAERGGRSQVSLSVRVVRTEGPDVVLQYADLWRRLQ